MENITSYKIVVFYNTCGVYRKKEFTDIELYNQFISKGADLYRPDCYIITFDEYDNHTYHRDFNFSIIINKIKKMELA